MGFVHPPGVESRFLSSFYHPLPYGVAFFFVPTYGGFLARDRKLRTGHYRIGHRPCAIQIASLITRCEKSAVSL